jgi:hypothetical protein
MSMPKYRWDDVYSTILPDKFQITDSHMLRLIKHKRCIKYGIFGNSRRFREMLKEPYDPLSLQEDYYFGRANQRLTP